jgi:formylglycine-generating enzyme required for sulfatase activity
MPPGFAIALLLCTGDNCDLVRLEPQSVYPTYEACRDASSKSAERFGQMARQYAEKGRQGDILCLREVTPIAEVDDNYMAIEPAVVYELPTASSRQIAVLQRGRSVPVTGMLGDRTWLRVSTPDGGTGFVYADHLRQLARDAAEPGAVASAPPTAVARSSAPPAPLPQRPAAPPVQDMASAAPPPAMPKRSNDPARPGDMRDCDYCPVMVALPGGSFVMGSNGDRTERPPHRVMVAPFAIGKSEVTEAEWAACVAAGACHYKPPASSGSDDLPVRNLSWDDATEYVRWLAKTTGKDYRLPSEAEWEYAARAGTQTSYFWGNEAGLAKANCKGCGGPYDAQRPAAATAFAPNAWGLYGVAGGVAEWTEDCWHASYAGAPSDGSPWRQTNCQSHVLRGGSWMNPPENLTVSSRNYYDGSVRYLANGVRVALTLR